MGQKSDLCKKSCNVHSSARRRPPRASTPPAGRQSRQPPPAAAILLNSAHKAVNSGQSGWRSLASIRIGVVVAFVSKTAAFVSKTPLVLAFGTGTMAAVGPGGGAVSSCQIPTQPLAETAVQQAL